MFEFFLFCFFIFTQCEEEVVQVHVFSRHCDRTSMYHTIVPKCPVDIFTKLGLSTAILTPLGENQCYNMGKSLRERYLETKSPFSIKDITQKYNNTLYYFEADQSKRTIRSLWAASLGLFPKGFDLDIPPYGPALPNGSQSVPIMQVDQDVNRVIVEYDLCPVILARVNGFFNSEDGKKYIDSYASKMDLMYNLTGLKYTVEQSGRIFDPCNVLYQHEVLCEEIKDHMAEMKKLFDAEWRVRFNSSFIQNLVGAFTYNVKSNMLNFITSQNNNNAKRPPVERKDQPCKSYDHAYSTCRDEEEHNSRSLSHKNRNGGESRKYLHYSGHDSGLAAVLANLRLRDDYEGELDIQPPLGSAIVYELVRSQGKYFVRVGFKSGFGGDVKTYRLKSYGGGKGCSAELCPWEEFEQLVQTDSYIPVEEWCKTCGNTESPLCK